MGIRNVTISTDLMYIAIGSYDEKIRIINAVTYQVICELEHKNNQKFLLFFNETGD